MQERIKAFRDIATLLRTVEAQAAQSAEGEEALAMAADHIEKRADAMAAEQPPVDADARDARARELYERLAKRLDWRVRWDDQASTFKTVVRTLVDVIGEIERERHPLHVLTAAPDGSQTPAVGLSEAYLAEVAARCAAATAGPWKLGPSPHYAVRMGDGTPLHEAWFGNDARFIAHAREDIPALLAEVDRLRAVAAVKVSEIDAVLGRFKAAVGAVGPMPKATPQPLTEAEAQRWARKVLDAVKGQAMVDLRARSPIPGAVAAALLAADRRDIPPEVRPKGTVMLNGGEQAEGPPIDPLEALRSFAPHACAALEYAAEKRGIGLNDVTDAMLDEDRPERLAGGVPVAGLARAHLRPDPLVPDPEDGTLCGACRAPRNAIHSALCPVRAGAKVDRVPAKHPREQAVTRATQQIAQTIERTPVDPWKAYRLLAQIVGLDPEEFSIEDIERAAATMIATPGTERPRDHVEPDEAAALACGTWEPSMSQQPDGTWTPKMASNGAEPWSPKVGDRVRTVEKLNDTYGASWPHRTSNAVGVVLELVHFIEGDSWMVQHEAGKAPYDESELRPEPNGADVCTCPATSEYDPPCVIHGVVGQTFNPNGEAP